MAHRKTKRERNRQKHRNTLRITNRQKDRQTKANYMYKLQANYINYTNTSFSCLPLCRIVSKLGRFKVNSISVTL